MTKRKKKKNKVEYPLIRKVIAALIKARITVKNPLKYKRNNLVLEFNLISSKKNNPTKNKNHHRRK
jgi:hypothetical protein